MKKTVTLLLTLSFSAAAMTGCISNQKEPVNETTMKSSEASTASAEKNVSSGGENYTLQFSTTMAADLFGVKEIVECMEEIENLTDGHIQFSPTFNGTLGDENELLASVMDGSIDLVIVGPGTLSTVDPAFDIYNTPFMYKNYDHALAFWSSDDYENWLEKHGEPLGITFLTTINQGFSGILNNKRDVYNPDDLAGLKLRVPDASSLISICNAMGAVATPIAASEQYISLSQGVIDGAIHSMSAHTSWGLTEIASHYTETNHMLACGMVEMNTEKLLSLPQEYRTILVEQFRKCQNTIFKNTVDSAKSDYEKAEEQGVKIIPYAEIDAAAFEAKLTDLIETYKAAAPDFYEAAVSVKYQEQ